MATRMQQRRGTAAQWISTNAGAGPVLNAGEIGWESDTNKFKIGDGVNNWTSLDYFADINSIVNPSFGTSITFEGATADSFETTISVTDPTADRTITIPDATDTLVGKATTDTLTNKTINIASNTLTGVAPIESPTFTGTVTIPAGAIFTGAASGTDLTLSGNLTVNGTTTNVNTTNLVIEDKNIILGDVTTPSDVTADGGGITLKGTTDKTFNWVDSTDSWTSSEHLTLSTAKELRFSDTDSSHYVGFKAPATVNTSYIWTLPAADGISADVLTTNGQGILSWQAGGAGGGGASFSEFMLIGA